MRGKIIESQTLKSVCRQFGTFALVGLTGTALHYSLLYLLVEFGGVGPLVASGCGALIGLLVNYFLNHGLTFKSDQSHYRAFPKFVLIASIGLAINLALMALLVNRLQIYYMLAQVLVTGVVLVWNFLANRFWTFRMDSSGEGNFSGSAMDGNWRDRITPLFRMGMALLALVLLIRLITLPFYPLIDPSESRYAEMARKMLETGVWVTPQISYGVPFWGKPPLAVWLNAITLGIFGVNEFAARLSALFLCTGSVWIVYRLALGRGEKAQAFVAPAILAGMTLFFVMAGSVAMDQCLNLGVTLALGSFWQALRKGRRFYGYLFFIGLSIGIMAKGPIALVIAGIPIGLWSLIRNEWKVLWQRLPWVSGTLLMLAITLPWFLIAELRTPGFLEYFFIGEHWNRFTVKGWRGDLYGSGRAHTKGTIWLYWMLAALPWSPLFLAQVFQAFWRKKAAMLLHCSDGWRLYCLLWMLSPLIFFTFSANIIWTYVLPALPGCALLLAEWRRDDRIGWFSNDRIAFCVAALVPLLFLGLVIVWQFVPFQFLRTQKSLVSQYLELRKGSGGKLLYLGDSPYSGQFYTSGKAGALPNVEAFQAAIANPDQIYFACPKKSWPDLSEAIKSRLQPVGSHNGFLLLYRSSRLQGE